MIPNLDIYRSANILVKRHGQDAPIHAAMRADAMLDKGDLDGYAVWDVQNRKSVAATRMSALGGKAEVDFGRLDVCL